MATYRQRLRLEGSILALWGAIGTVVLLVAGDGATDNPASTAIQLFVVAAGLLTAGPILVRRWAGDAELAEDDWTGDPTPLWQLPLIVAVLAGLVALASADAALRVTGGCVIVGLVQALVLERTAAELERRLGGSLVRGPGSRIWRTRLGVKRSPARRAQP